MGNIAIIAEGVTDQRVLRALLSTVLGRDARFAFVQPPQVPVGSPPAFGGFELVFQAIREGRHREALQTSDLLVLHLDTDMSEHPAFGVPWREEGRTLSVEELVSRVTDRLNQAMGEDFVRDHGERVLFAIPVHATECWILALLTDGSSKITGCLEAANREIKRRDLRPLSNSRGEKLPVAYDELMTKIGGNFQGVPVTDVDGEIVLGFDRPKLQAALEKSNLVKA